LFSGPLYYAAEPQLRDLMGVVHQWTFDILLGLIALHILTIMYYQFRLKKQLIQPMLVGTATDREGHKAPVSALKAVLVAIVIALLLWQGLELAPQPQPLW
jgi:hypothetical protein